MSKICEMTCSKCGGIAFKSINEFKGQKIDGCKCEKCGEEYLDPAQAEKILQDNKNKSK